MLTAVLLAAFPGYANAEQPAQKGTPAATLSKGTEAKEGQKQAAKSYSPKEKENYLKKVAADLKEFPDKMGALKTEKWNTVPQQKKRIFQRSQVVFQQKLNAAKGKFAALDNASEKEWGGLKEEMDQAMEELENAYNSAESLVK